MNKSILVDDMLQKYQSFKEIPNIDTLNDYQLSNILEEKFCQEKKVSHYKRIYNKITGLDIDHICYERKDIIKMIFIFSILSKHMKGWYGLICEHSINNSSHSLDNNSHDFKISNKKSSNNAVIIFLYKVLSGDIENKKIRESFIFDNYHMTNFERMLHLFDNNIQDAFNVFQRSMVDFNDVNMMPDYALAESCDKIYELIECTINLLNIKNTKEDLISVNLLKHASLNRAINDINAIIEIQEEVILDLDSMSLDVSTILDVIRMEDIFPILARIFSMELNEIDTDLIKVSKFVIMAYCKTHRPSYINDADFSAMHTSPKNIAISAFLLLDNILNHKKINTRVRGETNPKILVYKKLKEAIRYIDSEDIDSLIKQGISEMVIKYVTTRYSLMVFGESACRFSKDGAKAHLAVKRAKIEIQKECYQAFKMMDFDSVRAFVSEFHGIVSCLKSTFSERV